MCIDLLKNYFLRNEEEINQEVKDDHMRMFDGADIDIGYIELDEQNK